MAQFTALSGTELKAVIMDSISKTLDESGEFKENITYPWVKYSFDVKLTSYPHAAMEAEPETIAQGGGMVATLPEGTYTEGQDLTPTGEPVETVVSLSPTIIDTPDQARVDADLPIPTAVPVKGIGIVDRPVKQAPPVKKGK